MSKKSAARARVRQLACLGLPGGLFVAALLPVLRALTQSDSAAFLWIDASGGIVNAYADRLPLPGVDHDHRPEQGLHVIASLPDMGGGTVAASMAETGGDGLYCQVLRCNRAHHVLHAMPVQDGSALGRLLLFRSKEAAPFGPKEQAEVLNLIRYIAHGVACRESSRRVLDWRDAKDPLEQAFVVANRSGALIHATEAGRRLLFLSTGCRMAPDTLARASAASEALLHALCAAESRTNEAEARQVSRDTLWGRFVLRAYPLQDPSLGSGDDLVGVHIIHLQPACLRLVNAMGELPLSPQQREIALMIADGGSNRDIAGRLGVSLHTVAHHIKQLFYKLQVHDRAELLEKIIGRGRDQSRQGATGAQGEAVPKRSPPLPSRY